MTGSGEGSKGNLADNGISGYGCVVGGKRRPSLGIVQPELKIQKTEFSLTRYGSNVVERVY